MTAGQHHAVYIGFYTLEGDPGKRFPFHRAKKKKSSYSFMGHFEPKPQISVCCLEIVQ